MDVHGGGVPAGHVHLVGHLADAGAEIMGQAGVPGGGDDHAGGEADGRFAGKVVVDGGGAVAVHLLGLAHGLNGHALVAADANQVHHVVHSELVQQLLPLGVVIVLAPQVHQRQAVLGPGGGHGVIAVVELGGIVIGVVIEAGLHVGRHLKIGGGGHRGVMVGKAVLAGQVGHIALGVAKLGEGGGAIGGAAAGVGDGGAHGIGLGVDDVVGVSVDGDHVVAGLQHISARTLIVEGRHILRLEGDLHGLGLARLKDPGLVEGHQVGAGLLNAAVGVGWVVIDLHHVLARHAAGVGDGDVEADGPISFGDGAHLLLEGGVAQAVAEGVNHRAVVVDGALHRGGLIPAVAHVDALHIVDKVGGHGEAVGQGGYIVQVGVLELPDVIESGDCGQVVHKGVHGAAGGVHLAGQDIAQGVEAGLAGAGGQDDGLDGGIVLNPSQLHGVGGVDYHDHLVELAGDLLNHGKLPGGGLQIVLIQAQILGVLAEAQAGGGEHGALAVIREGIGYVGIQAGGQVGALAARAGEDDHGYVGIGRCLVEHPRRLILGDGGLGAGPVLAHHADAGALVPPAGVEAGQVLIVLDARLLDAFQQGDGGVQPGQGAGAGAAVHGVGGRPAEGIHLGALPQGEQAALVLEQHKALVGNVLAQGAGVGDALLADVAAAPQGHAHDAVQRSGEDHVHDDHQRHNEAHPGGTPGNALGGLGQLHGRDGHSDGHHQDHGQGDEIALDHAQCGDDVVHVDA